MTLDDENIDWDQTINKPIFWNANDPNNYYERIKPSTTTVFPRVIDIERNYKLKLLLAKAHKIVAARNKDFNDSGSQGAEPSSHQIQLPNLGERLGNSTELPSAHSRTTSPTNSSNSTTHSQFTGQSDARIATYREGASNNYPTSTRKEAERSLTQRNSLTISGASSSAFTGSTPSGISSFHDDTRPNSLSHSEAVSLLNINADSPRSTSSSVDPPIPSRQSPSSAEDQKAKYEKLFSKPPLVSWEEMLANSIKNNSNSDHPAQSYTNTHSSQNLLREVPRGSRNYPQDPNQRSNEVAPLMVFNIKSLGDSQTTHDTNFAIDRSGKKNPPTSLQEATILAARQSPYQENPSPQPFFQENSLPVSGNSATPFQNATLSRVEQKIVSPQLGSNGDLSPTPILTQQTPELIKTPKGTPNDSPPSPQNLEKNSCWYTSLSSAYQNFLAFYKVFKEDCVEAFTFNKKSTGTETENGGAKPSTIMTAKFCQALVRMVSRSTSNSGTPETESLLPKMRRANPTQVEARTP
jgi:hypothetical protein